MTGPVDTKRDEEILRLVSEGKSYSVVAEMLDLRNAKGELSRNIVSGAIFRARKAGRYDDPADERFSHTNVKRIRAREDTKRSQAWLKRQATLQARAPQGQPRIPLKRMHPVARERELAKIAAVQEEVKLSSEAPITDTALTFMQLHHFSCKRPLGHWKDKAEFFCGKPRMDAKTAYCADCHRVMYRPAFAQISLRTPRGRAA